MNPYSDYDWNSAPVYHITNHNYYYNQQNNFTSTTTTTSIVTGGSGLDGGIDPFEKAVTFEQQYQLIGDEVDRLEKIAAEIVLDD